MWEVRVIQVNGFTKFVFNEITDALNFCNICLECGDEETNVTARKIKEEE